MTGIKAGDGDVTINLVTAVPLLEPASLALLGAGLLGLFGSAALRRSRSVAGR